MARIVPDGQGVELLDLIRRQGLRHLALRNYLVAITNSDLRAALRAGTPLRTVELDGLLLDLRRPLDAILVELATELSGRVRDSHLPDVVRNA